MQRRDLACAAADSAPLQAIPQRKPGQHELRAGGCAVGWLAGGQGAVRGGGGGDGAGSLPGKPADIVCARNFSVCLLHDRADVQVRDRVHPPSLPVRTWGGTRSPGSYCVPLHDQEDVQVGTCRLLILCTMHDALGLRWAEVVGSTDMLSCRWKLLVVAMYTSRCPYHLLNTRRDVCTDSGLHVRACEPDWACHSRLFWSFLAHVLPRLFWHAGTPRTRRVRQPLMA